MRLKNLCGVLAAAVVAGATLQATQFKSVYRAPGIESTSFAGKKVAALVIADDEAFRMSAEEALVRALAARGVQPVAAYRLIPREELRSKEQAKRWFEQAGAEGVVVLRPVRLERKTTEYAPQWTTGYYQSLWGYYGYGWTAAWSPGYTTKETIVVVETMVFSVPKDSLLWAAVSETANPKSMDAYMKALVNDAVKEMRKAGLIRESAK
jgi:hypothetical protein